MISICRACSHTICRHRIGSSRLTHSSFVRLLEIGLRVIRAVPSSSSFARYVAAGRSRSRHLVGGVLGVSRACGFTSFSPAHPIRGRGDDVPRAYQSADGIDGGRAAAHVMGGDAVLFSLAYAVPSCSSLVRYEKRDGGLFVGPRPVVVVSRSYRRCSGR